MTAKIDQRIAEIREMKAELRAANEITRSTFEGIPPNEETIPETATQGSVIILFVSNKYSVFGTQYSSPQIIVQPTSQSNSYGGLVIFKVKAQHRVHNHECLMYQWFFNRVPIIGL
ncbi:hypothetical protein HELRODRAFT_174490 [Helobdella robusta]|uniref:Uncharacterized protein n=1 Tax=Helobdella robusta TaxID=6412 RepID=T1F866_HELRO|nr:hypothetical protein HELRODRAFT_174490 [Helobdella robusta]ESO01533.1 hypothetical protein HELRODRAFT_174490 [Helobdella robusta]